MKRRRERGKEEVGKREGGKVKEKGGRRRKREEGWGKERAKVGGGEKGGGREPLGSASLVWALSGQEPWHSRIPPLLPSLPSPSYSAE